MTQDQLSYDTKLITGLAVEPVAVTPIWLIPFTSYQQIINQSSSGNQSGESIEKVMGVVSENPPS